MPVWQINTALVERINLTIRSMWRRWDGGVSTLCKVESGLRPTALSHLLLASPRTPIPRHCCTPQRTCTAPAPPNAGSRGHPRWRRAD